MASVEAQFKILENSQLSPPSGSLAEFSLPFTFLDTAWTYAGAVQRIFFFPFPCSNSHFISTILPNLKFSLSQALGIFYPLYGKIRPSMANDDKFELSYVDGDSVSFVVAQIDAENFEDLSGCHARDVNRLLPLRPELPAEPNYEAKPVLAIQVTLFPNQGITIGISVHHAACDGHSSLHFFRTWASICRTGGSSSLSPPIFDRTMIPDPHGASSVYLENWRSFLKKTEHVTKDGGLNSDGMVSTTFRISATQVQKLKEAVTAKANEMNFSSFHCSTAVVTFAIVWVCMVKARGFPNDRTTYFGFVANCSNEHSPPIPPNYLGNRIGSIFVDAKAGELIEEDGLVVAVRIISKGIQVFRNNAFGEAKIWLERWLSLQFGQQPLTVAGSPQLRIYDIDFGWGKPKKVEVTSIMGSGAMSFAESPTGGVEIGFILPKQVMDEFAEHFSQALKCFCIENDG